MITMATRAVTCLLAASVFIAIALMGTATAEIYTVGGDRGWIVPNAGLNYTVWAQNITVRVNDSLYFHYNPNAHNVLSVNSTVYAACGTVDYLGIWDSGDTTVVLQNEGTMYFICGAPLHCSMGQAFSIDVNAAPSELTPTTTNTSSSQHNSVSASNLHSWMPFVTAITAVLVADSLLF